MRVKLLAFIGLVFSFSQSYASTIPLSQVNQLIVFGDSLSDNGNAAFALGGTIPGNYAPNAFTNGTNTTPSTNGPLGLWIDQFSTKLQLPDPKPFLPNPLSGTNFAVASAQTGSANPQDISNQLTVFGTAHPLGAPSSALYAIWGGANDLYNGSTDPKGAADNLFANIISLSGDGAKYFLWLNLPQLGDTPRGRAMGSSALNTASSAFNAEWSADLAKLQSQGIDVVGIDINSLFLEIMSNPSGFGLTNVTDPAQGNAAVNPNDFLFWDAEHPTTAADALIANFAFDSVATPEPLSTGLAFIGLCGILAATRLRCRAIQNR